MQKLLIATKNPGKFTEISEVIGDLGVELVFLGDIKVDDGDFVEDGSDFKENAWKKADYYSRVLEMPALGEDSGILVNALKGELGVKTRRWGAGETASDEKWMDVFMKKMDGVEDRGAKFVCCSCVVGDGIEEYFEGETVGKIADKVLAPFMPGLPLSSVFVPEGFNKAYAELGVEEKNKVSHRGKALKEVRDFLKKL